MNPTSPRIPTDRFTRSALCAAALLAAFGAQAGEGFKLRQSPVGVFGGEMAAPADNEGFFSTAAVSVTRIYKVVDANGDDIVVAPRKIGLATGTPSGGAIPNNTFTLNAAAGKIDFLQHQTNVNLVAGYLTDASYGGGRMAFALNLPLIWQDRKFTAAQPLGTVSPTPPAPAAAVVNGVAAATNAAIQAGVAATNAMNNQSPSGIGDVELSSVWVRHADNLKVVAGASVFVPTGVYDKNRGPNPGFGKFYTIRPGVAVTYALNPKGSVDGWDTGVTVGGRISYGVNTTNKDTDYRSGDFVYAEGAIVKVTGTWAYGANLTMTQQVSDDSGTGAPADGGRYRNNSFGPFISYKMPGKDAGFNLHYSRNFGSRNALVAETIQLRFIKAW